MNLLHYLVQVNLYLVLFYGFYRLLLSGETFYALNRIYLVGSAVLSFGIPFWYSDYVQSFFITQQVNEVFYSVLSPAVFGVRASAENPFTWYDLLKIFYIICTAFLSIKLIFNLLQLKKLLENKSVHAKQGVGFSFFNFVFVDKDLQKREVVLEHEYVHIRQLHSVDVMLFELIAVLCWCNPVVYLYKKSIKNIHEFIADDIASCLEPTKADYAMLLFSQQFGLNPHQLTNSFFHHSTLKRRIEMLQKPRSRKIALLKYGFTAPLFALMLVIASASIARHESIKKVEVLIEKASKMPVSELPIISFRDIISTKNAIISGKITSHEDDKPLAGVRIIVIGKNKGTTSDMNGDYKIDALPEDELTFSFEGFEINTVPVTDKIVIDVKLRAYSPISYNALSETVVVAQRNNRKYDEEEIFTIAEETATFEGGIKEMYKFVAQNLRYPAAAQRANVSGKVFVKFVVRKDGYLSDFEILKGIGFGCDEETVRVLGMMPKWTPGKQNGKLVSQFYTMPISFVLEGEDDKKGKLPEKLTVIQNGVTKTWTNKEDIKTEIDKIWTKTREITRESNIGVDMSISGDEKEVTYTIYEKAKSVIPSNLPISKVPKGESKVNLRVEGQDKIYPFGSSNEVFKKDEAIWVIDGKVSNKDAISAIIPEDIGSISVLKSVKASEIYGEIGKNGVILVTTKKGKEESKFTIKGKQLFTLKVGKNREIIDTKTANEFPTERIMQVIIVNIKDIMSRKTALNEYEEKVFVEGYDGWVDIWVREQ